MLSNKAIAFDRPIFRGIWIWLHRRRLPKKATTRVVVESRLLKSSSSTSDWEASCCWHRCYRYCLLPALWIDHQHAAVLHHQAQEENWHVQVILAHRRFISNTTSILRWLKHFFASLHLSSRTSSPARSHIQKQLNISSPMRVMDDDNFHPKCAQRIFCVFRREIVSPISVYSFVLLDDEFVYWTDCANDFRSSLFLACARDGSR